MMNSMNPTRRASKTTVRIPLAGLSDEPARRAAQIAAIALTLPAAMFGR